MTLSEALYLVSVVLYITPFLLGFFIVGNFIRVCWKALNK